MRKLAAPVALAVAAAVAVPFAVATGGHAARTPGLVSAVGSTERVASQRYAIHVRITRARTPVSLHIRGQASRDTVSVKLRMADVKLPDGTVVPGPDAAALLEGPFLYERAPSALTVQGKLRWLRLRVADLTPTSADLRAVHSMTPHPLLRLLGAARIAPAAAHARAFHGTVAYDSAAVRALARLTGGIEFRRLHVSALLGGDGLVHRIVVTGRTADGTTTFSLRAFLFGFGKPLHVTPPRPGTFLDEALAELAA